ncbi:MAG: carboxypeptidase-like regulatory domain-containing protein [Halanaerobium sp.]|nr:carboxypeptidase-like regulatory domain-containing protein [Halanaerobium sp.]
MKKLLGYSILLLLLTLMFAGCSSSNYGLLEGTVVSSVGGAPVEGASVMVGEHLARTDERGYFAFQLPPGTYDVVVTRSGRATSKYQDLIIPGEGEVEINLVQMPALSSNDNREAPRIVVDGIEANTTLSGIAEVYLKVEGNQIEKGKLFLGGYTLYPDLFWEIFSTMLVDIPSSQYPNGQTELIVEVRDIFNNVTKMTIPVYINNPAIDDQVPQAPAAIEALAISFGEDVQIFSQMLEAKKETFEPTSEPLLRLANGDVVNLNALPGETTNYVRLYWADSTNNNGYNIYRSFDGENFEKIASRINSGGINTRFPNEGYSDVNPGIPFGKEVFYYVTAYNSAGESEPSPVVKTAFLPPANVRLTNPAQHATDVPLQPVFNWEVDRQQEIITLSGQQYQEKFFFDLVIKEALLNPNDTVWLEKLEDVYSFAYPEELKPATVYDWDIYTGQGQVVYMDTGQALGAAIAVFAGGEGSINGYRQFVTTASGQ